jgi:fibro-slime domain-containing protein
MKRCLCVMAGAALACSAAWAGSTKQFLVLLPGSADWVSSAPMISTDGGKTGKPMVMDGFMCGWYKYAFAEDEITDNVLIYRDDDAAREDMLGMNGNWETGDSAVPIPLKTIFELGHDSLFFVADESQKLNEDGWLFSYAEADVLQGTCSYEIPWIVYDSDAKLHPAFSCYAQGGEGCQAGAQGVDLETALKAVNDCIGVTSGLVESVLDLTTKKPRLTTAGKKCFIDEKYFNQLFNYTEGVNEMSCYDMPVLHMERGGWWEFSSDYYMPLGTSAIGGFFPVEQTDDASVKLANPDQTPLSAARTKRDAEGPVFYGPSLRKLDSLEGVPVFDLLCNGPGWSKGHNCEGIFDNGSTTEEFVQTALKLPKKIPDNCVLGWSCPDAAPEGWPFYENGTEKPVSKEKNPEGIRWTSLVKEDGTGGRNHHFCYETHAKFTYKPGLRLALRGGDDIWAFIDNKLAIDLGGVHLDAPGYVDLDAFEGASGKLEVGQQYDVDIFACDRRTTMSNFEISTNMFLAQLPQSAITVKGAKMSEQPSATSYSICYTKSANVGTCGMATEPVTICDSIAPSIISYTLVNGSSVKDSAVADFEKVSTPGVYKGGIDLTNLSQPKIDLSKVTTLPDGRYTLFVTIDGKSKKVTSFRIGEDDSAIKPVASAVKSLFAVRNDMRSALTISVTNAASAKYAVMDLQGRVVRQGVTAGAETIVPNLKPGSYIVKVARETRRVNVR